MLGGMLMIYEPRGQQAPELQETRIIRLARADKLLTTIHTLGHHVEWDRLRQQKGRRQRLRARGRRRARLPPGRYRWLDFAPCRQTGHDDPPDPILCDRRDHRNGRLCFGK